MSDSKREVVYTIDSTGKRIPIFVPRTRLDVEQQPHISARVLALLAFSTRVGGVRRWSDFTRLTFRRLHEQYGEEAMRTALCALLDEINTGFRPSNPIGLYIHRVRSTANSTQLDL